MMLVDRYLPRAIVSALVRAQLIGTKQKVRIEAILRYSEGAWVCGSAFYENYLPTFSQRIGEMIRADAPIATGRCTNPEHEHEGNLAQYRWESE